MELSEIFRHENANTNSHQGLSQVDLDKRALLWKVCDKEIPNTIKKLCKLPYMARHVIVKKNKELAREKFNPNSQKRCSSQTQIDAELLHILNKHQQICDKFHIQEESKESSENSNSFSKCPQRENLSVIPDSQLSESPILLRKLPQVVDNSQ